MNLLITGGAGFIGSNLVESFLKEDVFERIRVLDNLSTGHFENIKPFVDHSKFEFIEGDIRNFETCQRAVDSMDLVSHQAALGSVPRSIKDPITTNAVNIDGFLNMLTVSKEADIKRFIFAASSSTYGDSEGLPKVEDVIGKPLSPYAITKYVNELYADVFQKTYGLNYVGFRYFNVYGRRQDPNGSYAAVIPKFVDAILTGRNAVINGDPQISRDFTYVENVVQANYKALMTDNKMALNHIYNIAHGERTTLKELWSMLQRIVESNQEIEIGEPRPGDIPHSLASIEKARELLDYNPTFSFEEGLVETLRYYKENL